MEHSTRAPALVEQKLSFQLAPFRFVVRPLDKLVLPAYKGSALRGGFGYAFKDLVCIKADRDCPTCLIQDRCSYFRIFETPVPKAAHLMRKYQRAPHPFVLTPPLDERTEFSPKDSLSFDLVLVGRSEDFLPYFIYTFEQLGRRGLGAQRGKFELLCVEARMDLEDEGVGGQASGRASVPASRGARAPSWETNRSARFIYDGKTEILKNHFAPLTFAEIRDWTPSSAPDLTLVLRFLTPVRISTDGRLDSRLDFVNLMKALLRRIQLLQYFHVLGPEAKSSTDDTRSGTVPAESDGVLTIETIRCLLALSESVETTQRNLKFKDLLRYSTRQEQETSISGFTGEITYRFPSPQTLRTFLPFLRLGELLHVGKGTSFGLGRYEVEHQP